MTRRGCNCCGCRGEAYKLWPDVYAGERTCFAYTKESSETGVYRNTIEYVNYSVVSDETMRVPDGPVTVDSEVDETTDELLAGHWIFEDEDTGNWVTVSDTTVDGTGVVVRERTFSWRQWELERRLMVVFNIDDLHILGAQDPLGNDYLVSCHLFTYPDRYRHPIGGNAESPTDEETEVRGVFDNPMMLPTNKMQFDVLWMTGANTATVDDPGPDYTDITSWLPATGQGPLVLLFYSTDKGVEFEDRGDPYHAPIYIGFSDRADVGGPAASNIDEFHVDWHKIMERTAPGVYQTKFSFPKEDWEVQFDFDPGWFEFADRKLLVELYYVDEFSVEQVVFDIEFNLWIDPAYRSEGDPPVDIWTAYLQSTTNVITSPLLTHGSQDVYYADHASAPSGQIPLSAFNSARFGLRWRDEAFEVKGVIDSDWARLDEDGADARYKWYPHWLPDDSHTSQRLKLRMTWDSDADPGLTGTDIPELDEFYWTQVRHQQDGNNLDCPVYCEWIPPYGTPQWRVKQLSYGGAYAGARVLADWDWIEHDGCVVCMNTIEPERSDYAWVDTFNWWSGGQILARTYTNNSGITSHWFFLATPYLQEDWPTGNKPINVPSTPTGMTGPSPVYHGWSGPDIFVQSINGAGLGTSDAAKENAYFAFPGVGKYPNWPDCTVQSETSYRTVAFLPTEQTLPDDTLTEQYTKTRVQLDPLDPFNPIDRLELCITSQDPYPYRVVTIDNYAGFGWDSTQPYLKIETGTGEGLLFSWDGEKGRPVDFGAPGTADPYFQMDEPPVYLSDLNPTEIGKLESAISGSPATYWYGVDTGSGVDWYNVGPAGRTGPFASHTWTERQSEVGVYVDLDYFYLTRNAAETPNPLIAPYSSEVIHVEMTQTDHVDELPPEVGVITNDYWTDTFYDCAATQFVYIFNDSNATAPLGNPKTLYNQSFVDWDHLQATTPDDWGCPTPGINTPGPLDYSAVRVNEYYTTANGVMEATTDVTTQTGTSREGKGDYHLIQYEQVDVQWRRVIPTPHGPDLVDLLLNADYLWTVPQDMYPLERVELQNDRIEQNNAIPSQISAPTEPPQIQPTTNCRDGVGTWETWTYTDLSTVGNPNILIITEGDTQYIDVYYYHDIVSTEDLLLELTGIGLLP